MKNSKRILSFFMALVMVFLVACGTKGSDNTKTGDSGNTKQTEGSEVKELTVPGSNSLASMDYVVTDKSSDSEWNANFVDGLLEFDRLGQLKGALAESWKTNEDKSVWTFKLRPGVKWVTHEQVEYADVTAEDFVTGLRHAAEFKSRTAGLLQGIVKGLSEFMASDFSDAAWEKVGVKAVDKLTVEYTLESPTPYFGDLATYSILLPINRQFLETKAGAKLGKPDPKNSAFGSTSPDSILYNGGYVLETLDDKSQIVIVKNQKYWDAKNVYLEKVTEVYDDGKDPYSIKKGFESGTYPSMSMRPTWPDYAQIRKQYEEYVRETPPNPSVYGMVFNFNRKVFNNTNYATTKEAQDNTRTAVQNLNFRKAVRAAFDRQSYIEVDAPKQLASQVKRNINNFPEAALTKDGKSYHDLVNEVYNKTTGENVDLHDGQDPFYGKENAMKFIEAAKKEGVKFPVHLDMLVISTSDRLIKQANSLKQSIAENTDNQIIVELVQRSKDEVHTLVYRNEDPSAVDYDISTFTGWSPDYNDPKSFVDIYSPTTGAYMINVGLGNLDEKGNPLNNDLKEKLGFNEYEKLYREADKEYKDLDKRYAEFAKADAKLIEKVLFIPTQMQARGEVISKVQPYAGNYALVGISGSKYKLRKLNKDLVKAEDYYKIKAEWEKERAASAKKAQ
ncbi:ABC transporter substrate-binding protein [Helcococcus bovis]|uniref:ABC transporter substrate-binding protein n=1 Tax=Helcococcus bovis TaxID=3153252 RepID=A0ABW9F451_9FIRM